MPNDTTKMAPLFSLHEKGKRRRRFERNMQFRSDFSRAGRLEVRRRDREMILEIAKHRYLNSEQVCRVFVCDCPLVERVGMRNGVPARIFAKDHRPQCSCTCGLESRKGVHAPECPALFKDSGHVQKRLLELFQQGYLDRPRSQLMMRMEDGVGYGSVPMVYSATDQGLNLLTDEQRRELAGYGKLSWLKKEDDGTRLFIEHTLSTADLSIGIDKALRRHSSLVRLSHAQLQAKMSEERRNSQRPYLMRVTYKSVKLSAVSDLTFAIGDRNAGKRWNFLAEIDRGHMPIERKGLKQTSIMRKLIAYAKAFEDEVHKHEFGWQGFRVLILTTSPERVQHCVEACARRFKGFRVAKIFLFGTLAQAHDPLSATFIDGQGNPAKLIGDVRPGSSQDVDFNF